MSIQMKNLETQGLMPPAHSHTISDLLASIGIGIGSIGSISLGPLDGLVGLLAVGVVGHCVEDDAAHGDHHANGAHGRHRHAKHHNAKDNGQHLVCGAGRRWFASVAESERTWGRGGGEEEDTDLLGDATNVHSKRRGLLVGIERDYVQRKGSGACVGKTGADDQNKRCDAFCSFVKQPVVPLTRKTKGSVVSLPSLGVKGDGTGRVGSEVATNIQVQPGTALLT